MALALAVIAALIAWTIVIGNAPVARDPHALITGLSPEAVDVTAIPH